MPIQMTTPGFPNDGWPIAISLVGAATTTVATAPSSGMSHYITGIMTDVAITIVRGTGLANIVLGAAVSMMFPHAIEIGNATVLQITHTVDTQLTLFGFTDKRMT